MIRLRVAGVAPGLHHACSTSAPRANRRSRSVAVSAVRGLAATCSCSSSSLRTAGDARPTSLKLRRDEAVVGRQRRTAAAHEPLRSAPARGRVRCGAASRSARPGAPPGPRSPPRCQAAEGARSPRRRPHDQSACRRTEARLTAVIEVAAPAVIAPGTAIRAAVGDVELAAAMAAAEQAGEQRFAAPDDPRLMKLSPLALSLIRRLV